jgi:cell division protein FtsZ
MSEMGMALMGTGIAEGENKALEAAQKAISSPLLEDIKIEGARGLLINVAGGKDMSIFEVNEAAEKIKSEAHPDANIIFGAVIDDTLEDKMMVTVIATGLGSETRPISLVSVNGSGASPVQINAANPENQQFPEAADISNKTESKTIYIDRFSDKEEEDDYESERYDIPTFMRKQAD